MKKEDELKYKKAAIYINGKYLYHTQIVGYDKNSGFLSTGFGSFRKKDGKFISFINPDCELILNDTP